MPAAIIVPCLNERARFPAYAAALARACPGTLIVSVDDGSREPLRTEDAPEAIRLAYPENRGKGHAVRHGWDWVIAHHPEVELLAFADADGAVPAAEIARLLQLAAQTTPGLLAGSRVAMLGRSVRRRPLRHYIGRIFATLLSLRLGIVVYDTQCGAKVVHRQAYQAVRPQLEIDGFCFDAELIAHLLDAGFPVREEPVDWHEQGDSRVHLLRDGCRMLRELDRIQRRRREHT